jgi:hypothetical protein
MSNLLKKKVTTEREENVPNIRTQKKEKLFWD